MTETASATAPPATLRLETLTLLRFAAALWVVALHLQTRAPLPLHPALQRLFLNGGYAMTVFFVLSGTVLAFGYHRLRPNSEEVLAFYRARFARIYAPYAVLHLIALCWVSPSTAKELSAALYTQALSFLGLQAWSPHAAMSGANAGTWSISVEFFFYALFPALLPVLGYLRRRWGTLRICAYLAALSGFIGFADFAYPSSYIYYTLPVARLPEFMLGVVLGLELVAAPRGGARGPLRLALALTAATAAALNPVLDYGLWIRANLFAVPAFAWLIYELARWDQRRTPSRGAVWRTFVYLGESSYCLFLAQMVPLLFLSSPGGQAWLARHAPDSPATLWAGVLAVSLTGAIFLHELVEKPVRRALLRHWRAPAKAAAPT